MKEDLCAVAKACQTHVHHIRCGWPPSKNGTWSAGHCFRSPLGWAASHAERKALKMQCKPLH